MIISTHPLIQHISHDIQRLLKIIFGKFVLRFDDDGGISERPTFARLRVRLHDDRASRRRDVVTQVHRSRRLDDIERRRYRRHPLAVRLLKPPSGRRRRTGVRRRQGRRDVDVEHVVQQLQNQ